MNHIYKLFLQGVHCFELSNNNALGSVGSSFSSYNKTKILSQYEDDSGEICFFGRNVFMGYLNSEKKTQEAINEDGWLLTGDIGKLDNSMFLYVTGRLKELIITAGGENISPVQIEEAIIAQQPELISNCMVVGDFKNYLTILIGLKTKFDTISGASIDELSDETIDWLKQNGSSITKVSQVLDNQEEVVYKSIQAAINIANTKAVSNAAKIQKFTIIPRDFSLVTGELGPTMKVRRQIVSKMYESLVSKMYE